MFKGYTIELENYPITKETLLIEFFKNKENIPEIEIEPDKNLTLVKEEKLLLMALKQRCKKKV